MDFMKIFKENLRKRREELRLTQENLAEKAGLSYTFISQLERGEKEPSLRTAHKIARALKTSIDVLISEKESDEIATKQLLNLIKAKDKEDIDLAVKLVQVVMEEKEKYTSKQRKK